MLTGAGEAMRNAILKSLWAAICALPLAAGSASAAEPTVICDSTNPKIMAIVNTHTIAPYPKRSMELGEQGVVRLHVTLGKDGVPMNVTVSESNASKRLTEAASAYIKSTWRWQPLPPECANAAISVDYIWNRAPNYLKIFADDPRYPAAAQVSKLGGWGDVIVSISKTGAITNSEVLTSTGSAEMDAAMVKAVTAAPFHPVIERSNPPQISLKFYVMFMPAFMKAPAMPPLPSRNAQEISTTPGERISLILRYDGFVQMGNTLFHPILGEDQLREALAALASKTPRPELDFYVEGVPGAETLGNMLLLIRESGFEPPAGTAALTK